jgi:hypothetical protein
VLANAAGSYITNLGNGGSQLQGAFICFRFPPLSSLCISSLSRPLSSLFPPLLSFAFYFSSLLSLSQLNIFAGEVDKFLGGAASGAITGAAGGMASHQNVLQAAVRGAARSGWVCFY